MLRFICPLLVGLSLFGTSAQAVAVQRDAFQNKTAYAIEFLEEGRSYVGKTSAISSISIQDYITAPFKVIELNIVTNGNALVRIYHSRILNAIEAQAASGQPAEAAPGFGSFRQPLPASVQAMADKAAGVSETLTDSTIIKEYPLATHARTIEYRVRSQTELLELYDLLKKHWLNEPADSISQPDETNEAEEVTSTEPLNLGGTQFTIEN